MSNDDKLIQAFAKSLNLPAATITDSLAYNGIPQWDSVGHMALITELESVFGIMLDTNDIIDMSSVAKAREIVAKYGVGF